MKKLHINLLILVFVITVSTLRAQEREYELRGNGALLSKHRASMNLQDKTNQIQKKLIIFTKDTTSLLLPFLDDFSTNKFTSYDTADYSAAAKTDSVRYSFKVNGTPVDSLSYIRTASYSYTYDTVAHQLDSVKNLVPDYIVTLFDDLNHPSHVTKTFNAWIPYYRPIYDSLGNFVNNLLVVLDSIKVLEVDSITFVNTHIFSSQTLWYENEVYLNSTFPKNPPSIGVATFDGLDSTGYPYNFSNPVAYGLADQLTSKYLDLSPFLNSNDSLLFSFYYEPQGLGNSPESTDSLALYFKLKGDTIWNRVWAQAGNTLAPDTAFRKVDIIMKSDTPQYMYKGFQFRFVNYATLSGNLDHWHIDYVRLKKISDPNSLLINDIAFVYPPLSFMNDYQAVPYQQYDTSMMKTTITNTIVNLGNSPSNFGFYNYKVVDHYGNLISNYAPTQTLNINPSYPGGNFNFSPITNPPVIFNYSDTIGSCKDFTITEERNGTADQIPSNDKTSLVQHLTNYFAYDDASAESAYGLVQAGGQAALKFTLTQPDALSGAYIYFNPVIDSAQNKVFKLTVWGDSNGFPGTIIYQNPNNFSPDYAHLINGFLKYDLDTELQISGTFYIGWIQYTAKEMNIGLDKNSDNSDKLFYNIGNGWTHSIIKGSLMIHPIFGSCPSLYVNVSEKTKTQIQDLEVYPNPANDKLFLKVNKAYDASIYLLDLTGKIILSKQQNTSESIDISGVDAGIYFVRVENKKMQLSGTKKLVVIK